MMYSDSLRALWCDVRSNSVVLWEIRELREERLMNLGGLSRKRLHVKSKMTHFNSKDECSRHLKPAVPFYH